jgi:hypothetical protein
MLVHEPREPAMAHDRHAPVHAVAQQIDCSHRPLAHSPALAHGCPIAFLPHEPISQVFEPSHSAAPVQLA